MAGLSGASGVGSVVGGLPPDSSALSIYEMQAAECLTPIFVVMRMCMAEYGLSKMKKDEVI